MRVGGRVALAGPTVWLPQQAELASEAVDRGRIDQGTADDLGYRQLPVARNLSGPELAVHAGRESLRGAGVTGADLAVLLHAFSYYQGYDFFSPAHYVAEALGARSTLPVGIQQMCNGGAAAVELAVSCLLAGQYRGPILVTTGDRFGEPGFDRWSGDYGVAYGDAGTAVVLHTGPPDTADLALLAVTSTAAPEFEAMHRMPEPFAPAARWSSARVDTRRSKKSFLQAHGSDEFTKAQTDKLSDVLTRVLSEAEVAPDSPALRWVVLPRLARAVLEDAYLPTLAELTSAEPLDLGRSTGHLGAGDLVANAAALVTDQLLEPGQLAVVLSAGAGFSWSGAVVRKPSASPSIVGSTA